MQLDGFYFRLIGYVDKFQGFRIAFGINRTLRDGRAARQKNDGQQQNLR
jgi:hypothetical protein